MTLHNGREFLSIPGPTTVPDEVLSAMHRPATDIYSGELVAITESVLQDLKTVFKTTGNTYIYISNGHGGWEAALTNVLSRGDKILVCESGRFALGWGDVGKFLGVDAEILPGDWRSAVDPNELEARLRADKDGDIKAVLCVQIDTASGVVNDIPAIRNAIDAVGHEALLMVDAIASLACMPFDMDTWGVDVAVAGSQKGLMTPPGLAFVAVNQKAKARHANAGLRSPYWDWTKREGEEHYMKFSGTPPVQMLFGIRKALDMLFDEGLEHVFERHRLLAGATWAAVSEWRQGGAFDFNITEAAQRSVTVTTIRMINDEEPALLLKFCKEQLGTVLGIGIGEIGSSAFRIAHMGHVNAPMMMGTLGAIEIGLCATGIAHGTYGVPGGVRAAAAFLGDELSLLK
ncbi:MAG: aminotransferase class V-fold PLP-dependent enzyme [Alphaproteobacteria bacterium]|nr:aminotransferase class V-fold PLP-dependent enzyme [Alphaproteobacteria bacterium]